MCFSAAEATARFVRCVMTPTNPPNSPSGKPGVPRGLARPGQDDAFFRRPGPAAIGLTLRQLLGWAIRFSSIERMGMASASRETPQSPPITWCP